jgi:glutaminyl-tRNA synthetase
VRVTYSSDYFDRLHELAVELIRRDKAYVCHQKPAEIAEFRKSKTPSPWRNRPVEESLKLFEDMRLGKVKEGEAVLRMKQDYTSDNPCMWDLVAYRVKFHPHPHTGDRWCIYPSYDYTHCIVDSLENITHSLCTLEFVTRHESYMWLLDALDLYKPHVWEFSRLNVTNTVLSKRRVLAMVRDGICKSWDDPRLLTINGLRRRGYSAKTLNRFCDIVGVTRRGEIFINIKLLEHTCREEMDAECPRRFCVRDPLKVVITNWPKGKVDSITVPNHPANKEFGTRDIPFHGELYIDRKDFRPEDSKDYYGLAPGKLVTLRWAYQITATGFETDSDGNVTHVLAEYHPEPVKKTKGVLTWVCSEKPGKAPLRAELRMYDLLFKSENPMAVDDWMLDINEDSLKVVRNAVVEPSLENTGVYDRFQFERLGYFSADDDSKKGALVFNLTVSMRDSFPVSK